MEDMIERAWVEGHAIVAKAWGADRASEPFTAPVGDTLMAGLEALPLSAPYDSHRALLLAHLRSLGIDVDESVAG